VTDSDDNKTLREIVDMARKRLQGMLANAAPTADLEAHRKLRDEITGLQRALDAAMSLHQVPLELCHALRVPAGTMQAARLDISAEPVRVIVQPVGEADPEREIAAWREVVTAVAECRSTGEQLRRMEPEILAIEIGAAALVLNTEHSRAAVRGAMRLLRHGALAPAPIAWLLKPARRHPRRAAAVAAVAMAAVVASAGLILVSASRPAQVDALDRPRPPAAPSALATGVASPAPRPSAAPSASASKPAPEREGRQTSPPVDPGTPATGTDDGARPVDGADRDQGRDQGTDGGSDPDSSPTTSPRPSSPPTTSPPPPGPVASPRPTRTRPAPTPSSPPPPTATAPAPSSPEPPSTAPAPAPRRDCHLLDVDADLPLVNLDVCL
jgi:hypothetical protein